MRRPLPFSGCWSWLRGGRGSAGERGGGADGLWLEGGGELAAGADVEFLEGVGEVSFDGALGDVEPVSYTHLTLPTTPYV